MNTPTIHRTSGVDEDDGAYIEVWTELPNGETLVIQVCQDQDGTISEERLVEAEALIKYTRPYCVAGARKGGAA